MLGLLYTGNKKDINTTYLAENSMKIMVADDSLVMRKIVSKVVESLGQIPVHAKDGQQAVEVLKKEGREIGLVLLDWNMPILNGMEVLSAIQKDSILKNIPVMMVSTESESEDIETAIQAGASEYVTKPFSSEDLEAKIKKVI